MSARNRENDAARVVVDSSVAFKWFSPDGESCVDEALALLEGLRSGDLTLIVPTHLSAEVLNGLRYSGLDPSSVSDAATALADLGLVVVPLAPPLTDLGVEYAFAHQLTVHDALFPALATLLDAELITADRAQARVTECRVRLLA